MQLTTLLPWALALAPQPAAAATIPSPSRNNNHNTTSGRDLAKRYPKYTWDCWELTGNGCRRDTLACQMCILQAPRGGDQCCHFVDKLYRCSPPDAKKGFPGAEELCHRRKTCIFDKNWAFPETDC